MNRSLFLSLLGGWLCALTLAAADKRIVLIAGRQSHGPGDHEFRAGSLLLKSCLDRVPGIKAEVYTNGWPASSDLLDGAAAVLIYADGGGGHPAIQPGRIKVLDALAAKGVGLGFRPLRRRGSHRRSRGCDASVGRVDTMSTSFR